MSKSMTGRWCSGCNMIIVAILLFAVPAFADNAMTAQRQFSYTAVEDNNFRLDFVVDESGMVNGSLRWRGKSFELAGQWVEEDELAGYVEHETASYLFEIEIDEDHMHLVLMSFDGEDDLAEYDLAPVAGAPVLLVREGAPSSPGRLTGSESSPVLGGSGANVQRDSRLVGVWAMQDIMSGGGMSEATQLFLQFGANGVFSEGPSRSMGGGPGWSGDTGFVDGTLEVAFWRTQGQILFAKNTAAGPWLPLAGYEVSGGRLLLYFNDGSRQLWFRQ